MKLVFKTNTGEVGGSLTVDSLLAAQEQFVKDGECKVPESTLKGQVSSVTQDGDKVVVTLYNTTDQGHDGPVVQGDES